MLLGVRLERALCEHPGVRICVGTTRIRLSDFDCCLADCKSWCQSVHANTCANMPNAEANANAIANANANANANASASANFDANVTLLLCYRPRLLVTRRARDFQRRGRRATQDQRVSQPASLCQSQRHGILRIRICKTKTKSKPKTKTRAKVKPKANTECQCIPQALCGVEVWLLHVREQQRRFRRQNTFVQDVWLAQGHESTGELAAVDEEWVSSSFSCFEFLFRI